jgi:hypothetical protein
MGAPAVPVPSRRAGMQALKLPGVPGAAMWVLDPSEYAALIGYNCPSNSGLCRHLLEIWDAPRPGRAPARKPSDTQSSSVS